MFQLPGLFLPFPIYLCKKIMQRLQSGGKKTLLNFFNNPVIMFKAITFAVSRNKIYYHHRVQRVKCIAKNYNISCMQITPQVLRACLPLFLSLRLQSYIVELLCEFFFFIIPRKWSRICPLILVKTKSVLMLTILRGTITSVH